VADFAKRMAEGGQTPADNKPQAKTGQ